jgi:hypothetical protein
MSEILSQENAIILAAAQKMVSLGMEASEKVIVGIDSSVEDKQGELILTLLTSYRKKDSLTDKQLESILYDLRNLSGSYDFPTVNPIVGQEIVYYFQATNPETEGVWITKGNWDGSTNILPNGIVKKGYLYFNTTNSTSLLGPDGGIIAAGTVIVAKIDDPGQSISNWFFMVSVY